MIKTLLTYYKIIKESGFRLAMNFFIENHVYDLTKNISTKDMIPKKEFGNTIIDINHSVLYMSSWTSVIKESTKKAIMLLKVNPKTITFIDVGCGKGKVLMVWSDMFDEGNEVIGIDINNQLLDTCKKNLSTIKNKKIKIINANAKEVSKLKIDSANLIFFLYNPFDEIIMKKFLFNLNILNKKIVLIYNNPVHYKIFRDYKFECLYSNEAWHPNKCYKIFRNTI